MPPWITIRHRINLWCSSMCLWNKIRFPCHVICSTVLFYKGEGIWIWRTLSYKRDNIKKPPYTRESTRYSIYRKTGALPFSPCSIQLVSNSRFAWTLPTSKVHTNLSSPSAWNFNMISRKKCIYHKRKSNIPGQLANFDRDFMSLNDFGNISIWLNLELV